MANQFDPKNFTPPNINFNVVKFVIIGIIVFWGIFSSIFTIETEEVGVIQRFGEFNREVQPGLNFKAPFGIETLTKVPVLRQLKLEFGFRTQSAGVRTIYDTGRHKDESLMLTGDLNAAQVEWIVQYTIKEPYKYLFKVKNIESTFRYINEAILREVVGDHSVDEVITSGRQNIATLAKLRIQELCNQYEMGIKVDQLILQDVNPPDPVKPAFNKVNEAEQQKDKLVNQAKSEYNKVIPKAAGEAQKMLEEAKGYATERVNRAEGEAQRFLSVYNEYRKAREVTKQRIYIETLEEVLSKVGQKFITDDKASGILPVFDFLKGGKKQ